MTDSALAMRKLAEHLQYLAEKLIKAAGALPDGDPWLNVSAVALELTRLSRQFDDAARNDGQDAPVSDAGTMEP